MSKARGEGGYRFAGDNGRDAVVRTKWRDIFVCISWVVGGRIGGALPEYRWRCRDKRHDVQCKRNELGTHRALFWR